MRPLSLSILASFSLALLGSSTASATSIGNGLDTGTLGSHDFAIVPGAHGHAAHWSWVATPPTDAPVVTSVSYFIHGSAHGGVPMTFPQIADIIAAAGIWNASGANVNLTLAASDAAADIHVHMDTTSACGAGAIGCAAFSFFIAHDPFTYGDAHPQHEMAGNTVAPGIQTLTMYDDATFAGSWYSGPAGGIPGGDLDFLTVAVQELGHHLGLGHNDAGAGHGDFGSSPMNGLLPAGNTARRALVASDIVAITHLYGAAAVPEPSTALLLGLALVGSVVLGRKARLD